MFDLDLVSDLNSGYGRYGGLPWFLCAKLKIAVSTKRVFLSGILVRKLSVEYILLVALQIDQNQP